MESEQAEKAAKNLTFLILAGGEGKRVGLRTKYLCFMRGGSSLRRIIEDLTSLDADSHIDIIARTEHCRDVEGWLQYYNYDKNPNIRRIIYGQEANTKAFAIFEVAQQITHTPLIAVLQADVFYGKELLADMITKTNDFFNKNPSNYCGLIYFAKNEPLTQGPTFKINYDAENCVKYLEEICMKKKDVTLHPVISVFDSKKLLALKDIQRHSTNEERAGTTYLYALLMREGYKFGIIESDFTAMDFNTVEAYRHIADKTASKNA